MLLAAGELAWFEHAFGDALMRLRTHPGDWAPWGFLGVFPKNFGLLAAGTTILLSARIATCKTALLGRYSGRQFALVVHAASAVVVLAITALLTRRLPVSGGGAAVFAPWVLFVALLTWVVSTLLVLAPLAFWGRFLRSQKWELAVMLALAVAYKLAALAFPDIEGAIADLLFLPTVRIAGYLDGVLGYTVAIDVATRTLSVGAFSALMAPACLGYTGLALMLLFLGAHLYSARRELVFPNVLIVIPVALATIWLLNAVRIALLMAIGASWSPDIAVQGFHSAAGWLNLTAVALASVVVIKKLPYFSRQPVQRVFRLSEEDLLLVPQLSLLAVTLVTLLFTATFDWLYPVRVAVVGTVLLHYRKAFQLGTFSLNPVAPAMGFAVFLMWIAAIAAAPEKSASFAANLFAVPALGAVVWIAIRLIGAVLIVPFAEELAFRGFLLPRLEVALAGVSAPARQIGAALISSLAFGALHGTWLVATVAGICFAAARYHRGRLLDAIVAHGTTNLLLGLYVIAGGHWSYW